MKSFKVSRLSLPATLLLVIFSVTAFGACRKFERYYKKPRHHRNPDPKDTQPRKDTFWTPTDSLGPFKR